MLWDAFLTKASLSDGAFGRKQRLDWLDLLAGLRIYESFSEKVGAGPPDLRRTVLSRRICRILGAGEVRSHHLPVRYNTRMGKEMHIRCDKAGACGACSAVNVPYAEQLRAKDAAITELFAEFLQVNPAFEVRPIIGMAEPFHYRNKVMSPFAPGRKNAKTGRREILTGMYAPGTHRLVNTDGCAVENAAANAVVVAVRRLAAKYGVEPYNEDTGAGFLRHVVVRVGHKSGEMLVALVTNGRDFPGARNFCQQLVRACPGITTIVQNINTRQTNVVLGQEERTLWGPGFILDELCGLSFRISGTSFYQVNAVQTEVLYRQAVEAAGLTGTETVVDAYCGTGTIGLVAAKGCPVVRGDGDEDEGAEAPAGKGSEAGASAGGGDASLAPATPGAARVIGVDSVASSIRDARENARHNGIANAEFVCEDATAFMRRLAAERGPAERSATNVILSGAREAGEVEGSSSSSAESTSDLVLFLDPPRAGSTPEFIAAATAMAPARIVYISCNPATQVRDLRLFAQRGYLPQFVQPVDMFPHTTHVETIVLMSRK